jgi:hypothetical protein
MKLNEVRLRLKAIQSGNKLYNYIMYVGTDESFADIDAYLIVVSLN